MSAEGRRPARKRGKRSVEQLAPEQLAPDMELLAIEERFVTEREAGRNPRLAEYIAAYPQYAADLADFAAEYLDDAASTPLEAGGAQLSVGTRRALDLIFPEVAEKDKARRVAEIRERYHASTPRLIDLVGDRGLTVEALAGALELTPGLVHWLDATPLAPGDVPAALIARLAATLGNPEDQIATALSRGAPNASEHSDFRAALLADAALSARVRAHWLAAMRREGE